MRSTWHSLAWKEWHEHKWMLGSMLLILLAVSWLPWLAPELRRDAPALALGMVLWAAMPMAMFIGAFEAAGERSRGTLAYTQALPISTGKAAAQKLIWGAATCIVPVLITYATCIGTLLILESLGVDFQRQLNASAPVQWMGTAVVSVCVGVISLVIWSAAVGVGRKDEVSAGAWALLAIVIWWMSVIALLYLIGPNEDEAHVRNALLAASPGGLAVVIAEPWNNEPKWWLAMPITIAVVVHALLGGYYVWRFGRTAESGRESRPAAARSRGALDWLPPPRRTPFSATAWKQWRESGPIALAALAVIVATTTLFVLSHWLQFTIYNFADLLLRTTMVVGLFATGIVGIGLFWSDLSPRLNEFWRSRPIDPDGWYWTKLATGVVVLAVASSVPLSIAAMADDVPHKDFFGAPVMTALVALWIFSGAVVTISLVRHAVYAAILSILVIYGGGMIVIGIPRLLALATGRMTWGQMPEPTAVEWAAAAILCTSLSLLIAWLAVRNDWGWKK